MANLSLAAILHKQLATIFIITAMNIITECSFKAAFEVN